MRSGTYLSRLISRMMIFLSVGIIGGCSSIDCPVQNIVNCKYSVIDSEGQQTKFADTLTIVTRRSNGTDSILFNRGVNIAEFSLPISQTLPEDTLLFITQSEGALPVIDSVLIAKTNLPQFESVDCQLSYFHQITDVRHTYHRIDSIVINKRAVNYDTSTPHLLLHFKSVP